MRNRKTPLTESEFRGLTSGSKRSTERWTNLCFWSLNQQAKVVGSGLSAAIANHLFLKMIRCWTQQYSNVVEVLVGTFFILVLSLDRQSASIAAVHPPLIASRESVGHEAVSAKHVSSTFHAAVASRLRSWTSPLTRQCDGYDLRVRQRLYDLDSRSTSWRSSISIHPTNFGERVGQDGFGRKLDPTPRVVVPHETVYGVSSVIHTVLTPHYRNEDQVSYHTLIGEHGQVIDLVDPLKRAFGAGNSAFLGEWAVTNSGLKGSVNNFALHVSLETPLDGEDMDSQHSGYTPLQYDLLALVLSEWIDKFHISAAAITTHRHVDIGGERSDPRSFEWSALQKRMAALGYLCVD